MENQSEIRNEGLIKDKYELIIKEFQSFVYLFYMLLVGIGMLFNYYKFKEFKINIFQYATIFDFLIAPFKDITIVLYSSYSILAIIFVLSSQKIGKIVKTFFKKRKDINYQPKKNKWVLFTEKHGYDIPIKVIGVLFLFFFYSSNYAEKYAVNLHNNIEQQKIIRIEMLNNEIENGFLIGKTEGYIFLIQNNNVTVYPLNNVKKIKIK